jgi:outer membrane protein TolC
MRSVLVFLLLASASDARAQPSDQAAVKLTLEDALERGVQTSARVREAAARVDAATAVVDSRRAQSLPQIAAQAGYTRTNHVEAFSVPSPGSTVPRILYPDIPDNYRSRLDLQWSFYNGGRLAAFERAAYRESEALVADRRVTEGDLRLDIARAYWTLVAAIEHVRVVEQSIVRTQTHLNDARSRLDAGVIAPHEVLAVETQQSRQELLAIQARGNRDAAEADLGRLTGIPRSRIEPISPLAVPLAAGETDPADAMVKQAEAQRAEREALLRRVAAAEARQQAAEAGSSPTIGVGGGFDYARPNPRIFPREGAWRTSWDASINVNWPLFDGGRTRAEIAETSASARAVRARLEEFDSMLDVEVRQRRIELTTSLAAIASAEQGVAAASEARRVAGERFLAGVATSADVLDAQVALLQAELDRAQAFTSVRIAQARMARALGEGRPVP